MNYSNDWNSCKKAGDAGQRPALNLSRAAEADRDLSPFDYNRDLTPVLGVFQHPLETCIVLQHVDVIERNLATGVIRTGRRGILSEILAEDQNLIRHKIRI